MVRTDPLGERVIEALGKDECTLLRGAGRMWDTPNSTVASVPGLPLAALDPTGRFRFATTSIVRVSGGTPEPLHYHTSNVVGLVVEGRGVLRMAGRPGDERSLDAEVGDVVVIPQGALHVFETAQDGRMDYIAFEFSDQELDYQAHWSPD